MRELSLNILDIAQNAIAAQSPRIEIEVLEDAAAHTLKIGIYDWGCGMTPQQVQQVMDPFFTTRTTRKVGMGIPLFKMAAEQTGGWLHITSAVQVGTRVEALFHTDSIDYTPLGDVNSTLVTLVMMNEDREFLYRRRIDEKEFVFDTVQIKALLDGVSLQDGAVVQWMNEYLQEQTQLLLNK